MNSAADPRLSPSKTRFQTERDTHHGQKVLQLFHVVGWA